MNSNLEDIKNSYILFKFGIQDYNSYYSIFYIQDNLESIIDTKIDIIDENIFVHCLITYDGYLFSTENSKEINVYKIDKIGKTSFS